MALLHLVDRVFGQLQRWIARPAPQAVPPAAPAPPKKTLADVELPPVIALRKGKRYHSPDCGFVQSARGQIVPFRSRQEADDQGLAPCQVCHPSAN